MPSDDMPDMIGAHIGSNDELQQVVRDFDQAAARNVTNYKRSEAILETMRWRIAIEKKFDAFGFGDLPPDQKRAQLEQALADHLREWADE